MHFSVAVIVLAGAFVVPTFSAPAVVVQDNGSAASQVAFGSSPAIQMPAVGRQSSQSAVVSTQINNQQTNQSFAVGDGPIVAILPAGSNLSATWDLSTNAQPTIGLASFVFSSTLPSVVAVAKSDSSMSMSNSSQAILNSNSNSMSNSNISRMNSATFLPVGVVDNSFGASTIASVNVPIGASSALNNSMLGPLNSEGNIVQQNHRIELQLIDFQMNNSQNGNINQNVAIYVKVLTALVGQSAAAIRNVNLADATSVQMKQPSVAMIPQTTTGMQQVFNGTYQTSLDNKITVSRTITQDLCGQMTDKAFLNVVIAPLTAADGAGFQQQSYTCVVDINFATATRISESFWSDILQCNSGNVNNYNFRLWYKIRQYNVDSLGCNQVRADPVSVS